MTMNQPTSSQVAYLGSIWGLSRDWEILERAGRVIGMSAAHVRKGRLTSTDIERVIANALTKRGMIDARRAAMDDFAD